MSSDLSYAVIADGPSDKALFPIIAWALRRARPGGTFTSPAFLPRHARPVPELVQRARISNGPDLIFVHRDAEKMSYETRRKEIPDSEDVVPVIPVRMTEAWLLFDEVAIRKAASNPNGSQPIDIPTTSRLEKIADPKIVLQGLLAAASGLQGRRLQRFNRSDARYRLADLIDDFTPLESLSAFRAFQEALQGALEHSGF